MLTQSVCGFRNSSSRPARCPAPHPPAWHAGFLAMLPTIERAAKIAFRRLDPESREERTQEVICNACQAYARLAEQEKTARACPSALARFAIAQVREGRQVGGHLNGHDLLSPYCQRRKGLIVERLDSVVSEYGLCHAMLLEDRRAGPAATAASRIDFVAWLKTLPARIRKIALLLATGESTQAAARRFSLSPARISQLRRELRAAWQRFQGESLTAAGA